MGSKWMIGVIAVISVAAVAGIGFASYSSTAVVNVSANAGSFYLVATADLTASSLAVGSCSVIPSGNSVTIQSVNMLPGDYCNWTDTWTDAGSIGGSLVTWSPAALEGPGCGQLSFFAPWTTGPYASVAPGGVAGGGYWNVTDTGSGAVSGACTGTVSMTYAPA